LCTNHLREPFLEFPTILPRSENLPKLTIIILRLHEYGIRDFTCREHCCPIGTWLYRIAYNASLERLSRKDAFPLPPDEGNLEDEDTYIPMPGNFVEWETPEALAVGGEERYDLFVPRDWAHGNPSRAT
jgi:hypothetical protein